MGIPHAGVCKDDGQGVNREDGRGVNFDEGGLAPCVCSGGGGNYRCNVLGNESETGYTPVQWPSLPDYDSFGRLIAELDGSDLRWRWFLGFGGVPSRTPQSVVVGPSVNEVLGSYQEDVSFKDVEWDASRLFLPGANLGLSFDVGHSAANGVPGYRFGVLKRTPPDDPDKTFGIQVIPIGHTTTANPVADQSLPVTFGFKIDFQLTAGDVYQWKLSATVGGAMVSQTTEWQNFVDIGASKVYTQLDPPCPYFITPGTLQGIKPLAGGSTVDDAWWTIGDAAWNFTTV